MGLVIIVLSEVGKTQKQVPCDVAYNILKKKKDMILFAKQRHSQGCSEQTVVARG